MSEIHYAAKRVLVVDDFQQHLDIVKNLLRSIGFREIDLTKTATKAISFCKTQSYDIILCDYNLGDGKNGQQILEQLKFFHYIKHTCIFIMVTAEASSQIVLGAIEKGPDGYIIKPFNKPVFKRKIDRLLNQETALHEINVALDLKDDREAIEQCNQVLENNPRYQNWCLKIKAELHNKLGDYDLAISIYTGVFKNRRPDWARLGMGKSLCAMKKYEEAICELEQLLIVSRDCVQAYDLLAQCYKCTGKTDQAQTILQEGIRRSPLSINRQKMLGDVSVVNKDYATAATAFRSATRTGRHSVSDTSDSYIKLARTLTDGMAGNLSKEDTEKAIEVKKVLGELNEEYGEKKDLEIQEKIVETRLFVKQQKPKDAIKLIESIEKVIDDSGLPLDLNTKVEMARTYMVLGDEEKLGEYMQELENETEVDIDSTLLIKSLISDSGIEEKQRQFDSLNDEGTTYYENNEITKAIELFLEALKLTPKSVTVNLNLVQALLKSIESIKYDEEYIIICETCLSNLDKMSVRDKDNIRYVSLKQRLSDVQMNEKCGGAENLTTTKISHHDRPENTLL